MTPEDKALSDRIELVVLRELYTFLLYEKKLGYKNFDVVGLENLMAMVEAVKHETV